MAYLYEIRWEILKKANHSLIEKYKDSLKEWNSKLAKNLDPGKYPEYPSNDEIFAFAEEMKTFVHELKTEEE